MKASDLMIGDWIMYGDKPVQVLQLTVDKVYKGFFPIPLTPEILKKNGFTKENRLYYWIQEKDGKTTAGVYYWVDEEYINIAGYEDDGVTISCPYVHTLQHALQLCGIEKEIIL